MTGRRRATWPVCVRHVGYLARTGQLATSEFHGQQRWFLRSEVEALVTERARWISYNEAARIIGCSTTTVTKLVHEGLIEQRGAGTTALASLGRKSVERVARRRAQAAAEFEARRQERSPNAPPDDEYEWISVPAAAEPPRMTSNVELRATATNQGDPWINACCGLRREFGSWVYLPNSD